MAGLEVRNTLFLTQGFNEATFPPFPSQLAGGIAYRNTCFKAIVGSRLSVPPRLGMALSAPAHLPTKNRFEIFGLGSHHPGDIFRRGLPGGQQRYTPKKRHKVRAVHIRPGGVGVPSPGFPLGREEGDVYPGCRGGARAERQRSPTAGQAALAVVGRGGGPGFTARAAAAGCWAGHRGA
jgi:hypothetical protein